MLKKVIPTILASLLLLFSLTSCFENTDKENNNSGSQGDIQDSGGKEDSVTPINENAVWGKGIELRVIIPGGSGIDIIDFVSSISSLTGTSAVPASDAAPKADHEFIIGNTNRDLSEKAYEKLYELCESEFDDGWLIYTEGTSVAAAYTSDKAYQKMFEYIKSEFYSKAELLFEEKGVVEHLVWNLYETADAEREAAREEALSSIEKALGSDVRGAVEQLYTLYDSGIYEWIANLYDPAVGGFYFSDSGRDNVGFLPDIESTVQALNHLNTAGMFSDVGGYRYAISDEMKSALLNFAKSLQSPEDGYFYHPQWGYKNELVRDDYKNSRRGRDLGWARQLIKALWGKPYYDTPAGDIGELGAPGVSAAALTVKLSASKFVAVSKVVANSSAGVLPSHLQSMDAWIAYIDSLNIVNDPYMAGNTLAAQHNEIANAGDEYIDYLTSYLTDCQNPETGFWGSGVSYVTMNGFMKLSHSYTYYGRVIPGIEKAIDSTITILLTPDTDAYDLHICNTYNTWVNFVQILDAAEKTGGKEMVLRLRSKIIEKAPELINITYDKVSTHKQNDGGFSYNEKRPCHYSQQAPVACSAEIESDVNATCISTTGIAYSIFEALGVNMVPLYAPTDADVFLKLIEKRTPVVKEEQDAQLPNEPSLSGTRGEGIHFENSEKYNTSSAAPLVSSPAKTAILGENDKYLYFYKDSSANTNAQNSIAYQTGAIPDAAKGLVFELDIAFGGFSDYQNTAQQVPGFQINFADGSDLYTMYFEGKNGKISTRWGSIISGSNLSLDENKWYNLKFETYEYDNNGSVTGVIKVYVNGTFICDIETADKNKTTTMSQAALVLRQFENDDWIAVDNVYLGTHEKDFVKENN